MECAQTPLFEKMEEYLEQNSLYMCSSITEKDKDKLEEAAFEWLPPQETMTEIALSSAKSPYPSFDTAPLKSLLFCLSTSITSYIRFCYYSNDSIE